MIEDIEGNFQILDGHIAQWGFTEAATVETFENAFEEFNEVIRRPEIDRLLVKVHESDTSWGKDIQDIWLSTSVILDEVGIEKWGVVAPKDIKRLLIQFLVAGGRERELHYEYFVSHSEDEILNWLRD